MPSMFSMHAFLVDRLQALQNVKPCVLWQKKSAMLGVFTVEVLGISQCMEDVTVILRFERRWHEREAYICRREEESYWTLMPKKNTLNAILKLKLLWTHYLIMHKQSAVVVLLEKSSDSLILTKRSNKLVHHPGEFCFPGGCWEFGDECLWNTALRELQEELGIASSRVECLKQLEPESTLIGTMIYPWFASIHSLNPYVMNKLEVSDVIALPMKDVKLIDNYKEVSVERSGKTIISCQFTASNSFVWGATARIMKQLCYL